MFESVNFTTIFHNLINNRNKIEKYDETHFKTVKNVNKLFNKYLVYIYYDQVYYINSKIKYSLSKIKNIYNNKSEYENINPDTNSHFIVSLLDIRKIQTISSKKLNDYYFLKLKNEIISYKYFIEYLNFKDFKEKLKKYLLIPCINFQNEIVLFRKNEILYFPKEYEKLNKISQYYMKYKLFNKENDYGCLHKKKINSILFAEKVIRNISNGRHTETNHEKLRSQNEQPPIAPPRTKRLTRTSSMDSAVTKTSPLTKVHSGIDTLAIRERVRPVWKEPTTHVEIGFETKVTNKKEGINKRRYKSLKESMLRNKEKLQLPTKDELKEKIKPSKFSRTLSMILPKKSISKESEKHQTFPRTSSILSSFKFKRKQLSTKSIKIPEEQRKKEIKESLTPNIFKRMSFSRQSSYSSSNIEETEWSFMPTSALAERRQSDVSLRLSKGKAILSAQSMDVLCTKTKNLNFEPEKVIPVITNQQPLYKRRLPPLVLENQNLILQSAYVPQIEISHSPPHQSALCFFVERKCCFDLS